MSKKTADKAKNTDKKTTIGGQALFEGIMMKGVSVEAMAVRKKDGSVHIEQRELPKKKWYNKAPFVRGCFNFVQMMRDGTKCMNKSMEISGMLDDDDEPKSKVDIWIERHFGEKAYSVIGGLLTVLMVAAMLFVFLFVPSWLFAMIEKAAGETDVSVWKAPFEGVLRLVLFLSLIHI